LPREQEVLRLHQAFDRQPAFEPGRPRDFQRAPAAFRPAYPEIELHPDPQVQRHEKKLHGEAQRLRVLAIATADELLVRGLRSFLGIYEKRGDGLDGVLDRPLDIIRHQDW
jgi:hypothetical protein